jgi:hypothetical protein
MSIKKVLPIGFMYQEKPVRTFEVNLIGGFQERIIHNETMRQEKPQTWTASVVASLLSTLGDESVSYEFEESGGKKIPQIIKNIPLPDAGLILVAGHVETFGPVLKDQQTRCSNCRKPNTVDIDLSTLKIDECENVIDELVVKLRTGWKRVLDPSKSGQKELGWEGKVFDIFTIGIPTIGDALRNEHLYSPTRVLDFQAKLVNDNLRGLKASKDGFEMPRDMFEAYKSANSFFADKGGLYANDRLLIRDALNNLPQVSMSQSVTCEHCGSEFKAAVSTAAFFPLVS